MDERGLRPRARPCAFPGLALTEAPSLRLARASSPSKDGSQSKAGPRLAERRCRHWRRVDGPSVVRAVGTSRTSERRRSLAVHQPTTVSPTRGGSLRRPQQGFRHTNQGRAAPRVPPHQRRMGRSRHQPRTDRSKDGPLRHQPRTGRSAPQPHTPSTNRSSRWIKSAPCADAVP